MRDDPPTGHVEWRPTWTQALSDCHGEDDEPGFEDVTVRMTLPSSIGGERVRAEFSNRFGVEPVLIGRAAIGLSGHSFDVTFHGDRAVTIPPGGSRWTDPLDLTVRHGDELLVDVYLPEPTSYVTAGGFRFDRSLAGDHVGTTPFPLERSAPGAIGETHEFPAQDTGDEPEDGTDWSLPAGGPFLRTIEAAGVPARAVVVAFGSSSTAMGWPQYAAALLPDDARIAIVNRGIAGNRLRLDAPPQSPSWGRAGLARFEEDVLLTAGVTHVVVAYNSNDWGLPGRVTPIDEMPTLEQLIGSYQQLTERSARAGLQVILATVTPLAPDLLPDTEREDIRQGLNSWVRTSGHAFVDFDAAIRSAIDPARLQPEWAAPDDTHPNINGEKRLARAMVDALARLNISAVEP